MQEVENQDFVAKRLPQQVTCQNWPAAPAGAALMI
jgi:hypothetical protein